MNDFVDYHNGDNLGLEPTTPRQVRGADVAQPKRRPYNASGSLSEYGVSPECDSAPAAQPAASAPVAAQAPQDESPADILPPPGIHTAVHYAGWLRREAHRHQEPKASVLRQAARMLDVLKAECGRLHQELIDSQAPTANADALLDALRQIAEWPDGGNRYGQEKIKRFARHAIDAAMSKEGRGDE